MSEPAKAPALTGDLSDIDVTFVDREGGARSGSLAALWGEPFELARPVREFVAFKGQKNFTGEYWAATSRFLVGYESWVERDAAMALDFEPSVVALASQPFRLAWRGDGWERAHTPDYFARLADGSGLVVDVRPQALVDEESAAIFASTKLICEAVGWQFRLVGELGEPFRANLRWLARYRHPRCHRAEIANALREVFAAPRSLFSGAELVGDRITVLPVLYHLLWQQALTADLLSAPLGAGTEVRVSVKGRQ
ncbi:TnsA-like heteromeric transposase endonuclease subunit [Streptomyces sp. NPDC058691]|uniref:TnsA-like heteromeric transposase endonuclease subunit n=1 Tax=Streptomyces sp. NPDC058691 TaxID=3346601 RepID=UPI003646B0B5